MEWRLFSPSAKQLSCEIDKTPDGYVLRVTREGGVLFTAHAGDPEPLRARAAAWRDSLEANGYSQRPSGPSLPGGRPSELRSAFVGLIECASMVELHDAAAARALRHHATSGLAAASLGDTATLAHVVTALREALSRIEAPAQIADLVASCHALLDRIEASPGYRAGR